jgi:hypothetical protein
MAWCGAEGQAEGRKDRGRQGRGNGRSSWLERRGTTKWKVKGPPWWGAGGGARVQQAQSTLSLCSLLLFISGISPLSLYTRWSIVAKKKLVGPSTGDTARQPCTNDHGGPGPCLHPSMEVELVEGGLGGVDEW